MIIANFKEQLTILGKKKKKSNSTAHGNYTLAELASIFEQLARFPTPVK